MIKFSHTLFALPFALLAAFLAAGGWPRRSTLVKILLAMVGARSAAMAHNRLADRAGSTRANPRTALAGAPVGRALGRLRARFPRRVGGRSSSPRRRA